MVQTIHANESFPPHQPKRVSDQRLASLDLTALVVATIMALGPLTTYAVIGG